MDGNAKVWNLFLQGYKSVENDQVAPPSGPTIRSGTRELCCSTKWTKCSYLSPFFILAKLKRPSVCPGRCSVKNICLAAPSALLTQQRPKPRLTCTATSLVAVYPCQSDDVWAPVNACAVGMAHYFNPTQGGTNKTACQWQEEVHTADRPHGPPTRSLFQNNGPTLKLSNLGVPPGHVFGFISFLFSSSWLGLVTSVLMRAGWIWGFSQASAFVSLLVQREWLCAFVWDAWIGLLCCQKNKGFYLVDSFAFYVQLLLVRFFELLVIPHPIVFSSLFVNQTSLPFLHHFSILSQRFRKTKLSTLPSLFNCVRVIHNK